MSVPLNQVPGCVYIYIYIYIYATERIGMRSFTVDRSGGPSEVFWWHSL